MFVTPFGVFMKRFFSLLPLFVVVFNYFVFAQEAKLRLPVETFGIGVELQPTDITYGGTLAYAINSDMHIGINFGFLFDGGAEGSGSSTFLNFGPYFKYFLPQWKMKTFYPFVKGQFLVTTESISYKDPLTQRTVRRTETQTKIIGYFGSEWFPVSSLGIYGGLRAVELQLDPVRFLIGTMYVNIGIEWFF